MHEDSCTSRPWQEWLIETAPEEFMDDDTATKDGGDIGSFPQTDCVLKCYPAEAEAKMKAAVLADEDASEDVDEPDSYTGVDAAFLRFQERMRHEPDQILRYYYRDVWPRAEPLQVAAVNKKGKAAVEVCHCGAARSCEFQVCSQRRERALADDVAAIRFWQLFWPSLGSMTWRTTLWTTASYQCTHAMQP